MNQRMKENLTIRNLASHTDATSAAPKKPINTSAPYSTGGSSSVGNSAHIRTAQLPSFCFKEKLIMMHDVVAGILFLHEQGYMHCDIKSPNFLVANVRRALALDLACTAHLSLLCFSIRCVYHIILSLTHPLTH